MYLCNSSIGTLIYLIKKYLFGIHWNKFKLSRSFNNNDDKYFNEFKNTTICFFLNFELCTMDIMKKIIIVWLKSNIFRVLG